MYNLKLLTYPDQTRRLYFYESMVQENHDAKPDRELNPFDGQWTRVESCAEPVRSEKAVEHSLNNSVSRTRQKVYDYSLANDWEWFLTLTFDPKNPKVDRYSYGSCVHAMKMFLKNLRRWCPDVRYVFVPEKHKDGAFHFHGLIGGCEGLPVVSSGVFQHGKEVFNIPGYKYGFSTATRVQSSRKAGAYLAKYISKDLCSVSKGRKRYWLSRNLNLPAREAMMVDFEEAREQILDNLFDSSSYYKHGSSYNGHGMHFFEFAPDCGVDFLAFRRWCVSFAVSVKDLLSGKYNSETIQTNPLSGGTPHFSVV